MESIQGQNTHKQGGRDLDATAAFVIFFDTV
jgi:hypothetical protein